MASPGAHFLQVFDTADCSLKEQYGDWKLLVEAEAAAEVVGIENKNTINKTASHGEKTCKAGHKARARRKDARQNA